MRRKSQTNKAQLMGSVHIAKNFCGRTFPSKWDKRRPGYWSTSTLDSAFPGHHIVFEHVDNAEEQDTEATTTWDVNSMKALKEYSEIPLTAHQAFQRCNSARLSVLSLLQSQLLFPCCPHVKIKKIPENEATCMSTMSLLDYIHNERNMDMGTMVANLRTLRWTEGKVVIQNTDYCVQILEVLPRPNGISTPSSQSEANGDTHSIKNPYRIPPRRLWDLHSNRVVELDVYAKHGRSKIIPCMPSGGFFAITHSWTADMKLWMTPINHYQWPVPLPAGTTFEKIRWQALRAGASYCWLDVLCLRQRVMELVDGEQREVNGQQRLEEWSVDIPTIGNVYRQATNVLRYFNGLGRVLRLDGWDDPLHWINRAWTLQETRSANFMVNACVPEEMRNPLHELVEVGGSRKPMREVLAPLAEMVADAELEAEVVKSTVERLSALALSNQRDYELRFCFVHFFSAMTTLGFGILITRFLSLLPTAGNTFWFETHTSLPFTFSEGFHGYLAMMVAWVVALILGRWQRVFALRVQASRHWVNFLGGPLMGIITTYTALGVLNAVIWQQQIGASWDSLTHVGFAFVAGWVAQTPIITSLRPIIMSLRGKARPPRFCSILDLAEEMSRRHAQNERDKVAGLAYLMRCKRLPKYDDPEDIETAWLGLVEHLPPDAQLELLFHFPSARRGGELRIGSARNLAVANWIPTWRQIQSLRRQQKLQLPRSAWSLELDSDLLPLDAFKMSVFEAARRRISSSSPLASRSLKVYDPTSRALLHLYCARILLVSSVTWESHPNRCSVVLFSDDSMANKVLRQSLQQNSFPFHSLGSEGTDPPFENIQSNEEKRYVLISSGHDKDGGLNAWVVAELMHPSAQHARTLKAWKSRGASAWNVITGRRGLPDLPPEFRKICVDSLNITDRMVREIFVVRKIGALVTDNPQALMLTPSGLDDLCLLNTPVLFI
ncbi:hypothetical protein BDZ91DRAFT_760315 [Kalaharituber pfeilii]|nr:hypothetical protein BDZ91DRAFT_760315 [Kalaharituber pfeilii]